MGNGLVGRYKPSPEEGYDHNAWRKPKARPKKKSAAGIAKEKSKAVADNSAHNQWRQPKPREVSAASTGGSTGITSTGAGGGSGAQSVVNWSMASAVRDPAPPLAPDEEDEDDDCANLADAAAKVWEDLMVRREATKDFGALFFLGELKDCVERAAKRLEVLRREASLASANVGEKESALSELCSRIEEKALPGVTAQWKLGDMAIRRGKGLCELSMVHHEAEPPYYEVRMVVTGSVVGTEAGNLLELPPPQKSLVRQALKDLEQARAKQAPVEEAVTQAQEELRKQHQALTDQVEKKLRESSALPTAPLQTQPGASGAGGGAGTAGTSPAAGGTGTAPAGRSAPPGLPELDLVRKWSSRPLAPEAGATPAISDYPDMRGLKEDLRLPGNPETTPRTPSRSTGGTCGTGGVGNTASAVPTFGTAPPTTTPSAPVGFPSLDELNRMEEQAAERERQAAAAAAAANYPTAHPGAAREVFMRPSGASSAEAPGGGGAGPTWRRPSPHGSKGYSSAPDLGAAGPTNAKDPGIPVGFPRLDPNFAAAQEPSGQAPQRGPSVQAQQQPYQQQQQQQPPQQQVPHAQQQPYQQPFQQPGVTQPGPVAAEWVVYRTDQGCPYYHNERTNETVWHLPPGARCREPMAAQGAGWWQQEQQKQANADDPFAELRQKEEEMKQQREQWAQWYAQYCAWYTQQSQQSQQYAQAGGSMPGGTGVPPNAPPNGASQRHQVPPHFGSSDAGGGAGTGTKLPPRGPAPPTLDAGFEDHATYAIKSSVLKEMEAMVAKGAPVAQRKKALRCLHLRWHPDKNPDKLEVAKSVFQFIEETKPWFLHDPEAEEGGVT